MPELNFHLAAGRPHLPFLRYLEKWLPTALGFVANPPAEISIALIGDTKMSSLHQEFKQISGPTDVLTFELEHDAEGKVASGEVVVCVPYARRESIRRGTDAKSELLLYTLHGILHLSGFDDLAEEDYQKMHAEEDRILEQIGIGAIFYPKRREAAKYCRTPEL